MNNQVVNQYNEYLKVTAGNEAAAASLTLAAIMLEGRCESSASPAGTLLTVKEAASRLRVSTRTDLRNVCNRGTAGLQGRPPAANHAEMLEDYQRQGTSAVRRPGAFGHVPTVASEMLSRTAAVFRRCR